MSNQQVEGVRLSLSRILSGARIHAIYQKRAEFVPPPTLNPRFRERTVGTAEDEGSLCLWFPTGEDIVCKVTASRPELPWTRIERAIFFRFQDAIRGLVVETADPRGDQLAQRIASWLALDHILVSRFIRRYNSGTYWAMARTLLILQDLTFKKYEGAPCTSGFIYSSQLQRYIDGMDQDLYSFEPFRPPPELSDAVFSDPAAFRYVDGRNAFYVIDNSHLLLGIVRIRQPTRFSIIDRANNRHILPLVHKMPGRVWVAFTGLNSDVNVLASVGIHFRWHGNHWHLRDETLLTHVLSAFDLDSQMISSIRDIVLALSDLRHGSVLLIADDPGRLPDFISSIGDSPVGQSLRSTLVGQSLADVVQSHAAIGILASDGLTTVSRQGKILSCGQIIKLAPGQGLVGGGRTQAACTASAFGLAIKVSEDGPITVFRGGEQVLRV